MTGFSSRPKCFRALAEASGNAGGGGGAREPVSMAYTVDSAEVTGVTMPDLRVRHARAGDRRPHGLQTRFECEVRDALTSITFHTSVFKAAQPGHAQLYMDNLNKRRTQVPDYEVRLHPAVLKELDGLLWASCVKGFAR